MPKRYWPVAALLVGFVWLKMGFAAYFPVQGFLLGACTVYAPGFRPLQFHQVRPGMTVAELETLLGHPLQIEDRRSPADDQVWKYSDQAGITDDFYRKWVIVKDGKVVKVFDDYWHD